MHRAKEGDREGYKERVREREGKRERYGEWENVPNNLEGEALTDYPIGEEFG